MHSADQGLRNSIPLQPENMSAINGPALINHIRNKSPEPHRNALDLEQSLEVYVGNLPLEVTEEHLLELFKEFNPLIARKVLNGMKCYAFVHLGSVETQKQAINKLHGTQMNKRRLIVKHANNSTNGSRTPERANGTMEIPALEIAPSECNGNCNGNGICSPGPLNVSNTYYAVPMEMRGVLLVNLLKDCFQDLRWLASISKWSGEAALLVTDTVPLSPFFWAVYLTEEVQLNMLDLFQALAVAESKQPFLQKKEVARGTKCMAECNLGDGNAWNRCWVLEVVEDLAVVFFVDFGSSATVPIISLRSLANTNFWDIPPLAQPFMLQDGVFHSEIIVGRIFQGRITGCCKSESHILRFSKFPDEEPTARSSVLLPAPDSQP